MGVEEVVGGLGYNQQTWDCCINHYEAYDWVELQTLLPEVHDAIRDGLGYFQSYWDGPKWKSAEVPLVEAKTWCDNVTSVQEDVCLTEKEVEAVKTLCYSPSGYRGEPMSGRGLVGGGGTTFVGPEHC